MCLLVVLHRVHPDSPLVVAANRDELLERPATAMTVLDGGPPRILGGRDHVAGGTWLAISESGLLGGLTNRPAGRRDPQRRSRGEWPLFLAGFETAAAAAEAFVERFPPREFNPGWVLVADRQRLFYIDMTGEEAAAAPLAPGVHVLENRPLEGPSPKADLVRRRLRGVESARGEALIERLTGLLASHAVPDGAGAAPSRPAAANAACVHLGPYGTRSATIVAARPDAPPRIWSADGPPCTAPLLEVTGLWTAAPAAGEAVGGG